MWQGIALAMGAAQGAGHARTKKQQTDWPSHLPLPPKRSDSGSKLLGKAVQRAR